MVQELTAENFDEITKQGNVVIDFWAPWCGPCKVMAPIFEELSGEMNEITFAKLNVEDNPELAQKFGVQGIPTLVLLSNGEEKDRLVGMRQKEDLKKELEEKF